MEHTITLSRPSADTRLGIKVISDAPDDPPVVKQLSGISEGSGLAVDDVVLSIDGTAVKNSKEAMACFVKAGTTVQLRIRRGTPAFERMQSGEFSTKQLHELKKAFVVLGGGKRADKRIGAEQVYAAVAHFQPDVELAQVEQLCQMAIARDVQRSTLRSLTVSFSEFVSLMQEVASQQTAQAVREYLDAQGLGILSASEATAAIKALEPSATPSDVASMLALLQPASDGLVYRERCAKPLNEAFAAEDDLFRTSSLTSREL